jgi:hypothetical protein
LAFVVREFVTSPRVVRAKDTRSATTEWVGYGSDDDAVARTAFDLAVPATFNDSGEVLTRLNLEVYPLGGMMWKASAFFGPDASPVFPAADPSGLPPPVVVVAGIDDPLTPNFSFDFTGVSEHVKQSKGTISATGRTTVAGGPADYKGAIGVTKDEIAGCDRVSPNQEWSVSVTFEYVTMTYLILLEQMVGTTNDAEFYHRPAKSTVFMGGNCQIDDTRRAKVTFKFLSRPNLVNIDVCGDMTLVVPAKAGSEYLWVSYRDVPDAGVNRIATQPQAAYVEQVVDAADWSLFRIGT